MRLDIGSGSLDYRFSPSILFLALLSRRAIPMTSAPFWARRYSHSAAALVQIRSYILSRAVPPPIPASSEHWNEEARRLRRHLLQDVVFHASLFVSTRHSFR